ncbi:PD-(D/E)XK nuclease family protein [Persephonella sp.]
MLFTGSYSFLKEKVVELYASIPVGSRITFIVYTNQLARYLKEYISKKTGVLAGAEFYTPIDISKKLTGIEPLQDFDRNMIFRKFLYQKGYYLDSLPEEFGLLTQQLKEYKIPPDRISSNFTQEIIKDYQQFLEKNGYYDREDLHLRAVEQNTDFQTDYLIIFGIKTLPPLYRELFLKLKKLSQNQYVFLPILKNSGYYQNYPHFGEVLQFYRLNFGQEQEEAEPESNIKAAARIYSQQYTPFNEKHTIHIKKFSSEYEEVEYTAQKICQLVLDEGVHFHQIAVVVPQAEKYAPIIKDLFNRYKIPYFLQEESRYIDRPEYKRLLSLFFLKENSFQAENILSVLSEDFINLPNLKSLKKAIMDDPFLDLTKIEDSQFKYFLQVLDFPEEDSIHRFLDRVEKTATEFLKKQEDKEFLLEITKQIRENRLYSLLFDVITYTGFTGIVRTFFEKELEKTGRDRDTVKILSPTSAEGNNCRYLFFLNLNSGDFPYTLREEILADSTETGVDYPYHLLMQQLANFVSLFDGKKEIHLSFITDSIFQGKSSPSFLVEELVRILKSSPVHGKIDPEKKDEKSVKIRYSKLLHKIDSIYKSRLENHIRYKNPAPENFKMEFVEKKLPVSPTSFSIYSACPYRYFFREVINIYMEEPYSRKYIQPVDIGTAVHSLLYRFYTKLPENVEPVWLEQEIKDLKEQFFIQMDRFLQEILPPYRPFEKQKITEIGEKIERFIRHDLKRMKQEGKKVEKSLLEKTFTDNSKIFKGRIDRVDVEKATGKLYIYDYKTGSKPVKKGLKKDEVIKKFIQLVVYRKFLQDAGMEVKGIGILSVEDPQNSETVEDDLFMAELDESLQMLTDSFVKNFYPPQPDSEICSYCEYTYFCPAENLPEEKE